MNTGTESQFEEPTIDRLKQLGYQYAYGDDVTRATPQAVVLVDELRAFLQGRYADLPAGVIEQAAGVIEQAAGAQERLYILARDLLDHFNSRQQTFFGKAMIVCMSRRNAVGLYHALQSHDDCPRSKW